MSIKTALYFIMQFVVLFFFAKHSKAEDALQPYCDVTVKATSVEMPKSGESDFPGELWSKGPVSCYQVPAISSIPRLPDEISSDARLSSQLRVIAAKGEYEPVSFIISPRTDIAKLTLKASRLVGSGGDIPATNIDIRVVKCWYQGGTAWYSYFGDSNRRELVPELLLHDDALVRVDQEKKENYLRVGDKYEWVSYPREQATEAFNYLTAPVADSKTLRPFPLQNGKNKQVWITIEVPKSANAGIYHGKIDLVADGNNIGAMRLAVKVLPFELPMPKTYHDLDLEYLVTLYSTDVLDMCERMERSPTDSNVQFTRIFYPITSSIVAHL